LNFDTKEISQSDAAHATEFQKDEAVWQRRFYE
jgi:hypothetical protein